MDRSYYRELAASGLRMPIGADLILREQNDPEGILHDGGRLGPVIEEAARRFRTPLALPVMDLALEKTALLGQLGIGEAEAPQYHFKECPPEEALDVAGRAWTDPPHPRFQAQADAIRHIAGRTDLMPAGMSIGPFSLMTKMMADPIVPVYMSGRGMTAQDDTGVATVERCLEMAVRFVTHSIDFQLKAGAKAIFIAEPAASVFYISPKQMDAGSDIFERYVVRSHRRIKALLDERGADLFFHCCGELTPVMVRHFASLDPAILSLGSSRKLWEDAALVPERTTLYGNLPSKKFYSDREMTVEDVKRAAADLTARMRAVGRPFILGSECDVLDVPGCHDVIMSKVTALMEFDGPAPACTGCGHGH